MLKYLFTDIVFQEIPDETSLAFAISGCRIQCHGCHSRELWEDRGINLTIGEINRFLINQGGVTCLLLMGGEHDIDSLIELFMYFHPRIKTAWYCGFDFIPKDKVGIVQYLNYVKLGHYDMELGGLSCPTTNQRLYRIEHIGTEPVWHDITSKMWSHK